MKTSHRWFCSLLTLTLVWLLPLPAAAQILVSAGTSYSQNFDMLASSGTDNAWVDNSTLPGWYAAKTSGGISVTNYIASTGSSQTGSLYSYGVVGSSQRALGSQPTGTPGDIAYGVRFTNDTAQVITNITISYTGEQWRRSTNAGVQTLAFSYSVGSSAITNADAAGTNYLWVTFGALNFDSPNTAGASGALDGTAGTNQQVFANILLSDVAVLPGQEIFLRWLDVNDPGVTDHGLAIDDLTVTFTAIIPTFDLRIQKIGTNVVLTWPDPSYNLTTAAGITNTFTQFTEITGATSPYTNTITGTQKYFRLVSPPPSS